MVARIPPAVAVALVLATFVRPADAAKKPTGRETLEKSARKACLMGDYQKGTEILSDLFIETKDLTYVYNQARCFEQNHRWEEAVDRFLEYQRKTPDASEGEKSEVEQHIDECKRHLKEQALAPATTLPDAAIPAEKPAAQPAAPEIVRAPAKVSTPEGGGSGTGLKVGGIAVGVAGIAAIATGVVLAGKTRTLTDELNKSYNRDKAATRDSYETWGWVSYGVGAAALVTGTTLCILGWRAGKSESSTMSILPILGPGTGGVSFRGAY